MSRMAVLAAKCAVQLDDGTDSAVAHCVTLQLLQAALRLPAVALERVAELVCREGAVQLLCGGRRWDRKQEDKRVCAAAKALADMCVTPAAPCSRSAV